MAALERTLAELRGEPLPDEEEDGSEDEKPKKGTKAKPKAKAAAKR
jgi:hypothetical protein